MQCETNQLEKAMQSRHSSVSQFSELHLPTNQFEGYLFKRTSKGFKTWNRRWFFLRDNQLLYMYVRLVSMDFPFDFHSHIYRKRNKDEVPAIMEADLRICTVRPVNDSDRRFCFEIISPLK